MSTVQIFIKAHPFIVAGLAIFSSVAVSWFIVYVIKPEPGCLFEGKIGPFYVGDPRGYKDPKYRTKINGGTK